MGLGCVDLADNEAEVKRKKDVGEFTKNDRQTNLKANKFKTRLWLLGQEHFDFSLFSGRTRSRGSGWKGLRGLEDPC